MDYDKVSKNVDGLYLRVEKKAVQMTKEQANFIYNLRKYISNEEPTSLTDALTFSLKVNVAVIVLEVLAVVVFQYQSILGLLPKIFTLLILIYIRQIYKED